MQILVTGSSGFLGRLLIKEFQQMKIVSIGRHNADLICDLSTQIPNIPAVDLIIHAAGKAHVIPKTEKEKQEFFDVNVTGTQNLLKGIKQSSKPPKAFVYISSVSVYGLHYGENIKESHSLNAKDTYGLMKIIAEEIVQEWCIKNKVICTILRLPLLVGPNPPGNLGVMIKSIKKGYYLNIAGSAAKKSMVMAEDIAKFILPASEIGGIYNLTDGYHPNFQELANVIAKELSLNPPKKIPLWLASFIAKCGDLLGKKALFNNYKLAKITANLTFDDSKARAVFGWKPQPVLKTFKIK